MRGRVSCCAERSTGSTRWMDGTRSSTTRPAASSMRGTAERFARAGCCSTRSTASWRSSCCVQSIPIRASAPGRITFRASAGEDRRRRSRTRPAADTMAVLDELFDTVAAGAFVHTADQENWPVLPPRRGLRAGSLRPRRAEDLEHGQRGARAVSEVAAKGVTRRVSLGCSAALQGCVGGGVAAAESRGPHGPMGFAFGSPTQD